jgi:hypothetical protein
MHGKRLIPLAGAALLLVGLAAAPAFAGGTLADNTVYTYPTAQSFNFTTSVPYWSVAAELPQEPADYDLNLLNVGGGLLASSQYGAGHTDFVAVDSNSGTEPYQTYYPSVVHYSGTGSYAVEVQDGASIVTIPAPTHQGTTGFSDPNLAFMNVNSNQVVSISDIYLTAGQSFWASGDGTAGSTLYLLEANPANSSSFIQSRAAANADQNTKVIDDCTQYTAEVTGWHALVMVSDTWPVATNPQQGIGIALHAFDATDPAGYCPLADFPGPTPAP